jgi:SAM-dependent methyltransferase
MERSLLIGCGTSRVKQIQLNHKAEWTGELTTMDMDPNCGADIVFDMESLVSSRHPTECGSAVKLPFEDNTFDEIGCYNAMEHWGQQGDWRAWFAEMAEYHRILKPGGTMSIVVPIGGDALADPGHTRFFHENHFGFLNQGFYETNRVKNTCFTDYRWFWKLNFEIPFIERQADHHLSVVLQKA